MGLFKCEKCGCVENTALGLYWSRKRPEMFEWPIEDSWLQGEALCSECAPVKYSYGGLTGFGKWHNRFPKRNIHTFTYIDKAGIYNA